MTTFRDIAHRKTLTDLCREREQCIGLLEHAHRALDEAGKLLPGRYGMHVEIENSRVREDQVRAIDRQFWRHALDLTGFKQVMDSKALDDWSREVEGRKCPAFTEDTVLATFLGASQEAGQMFRRGVYRVFRGLSQEYRSNERDAFKVHANKRYVLQGWVDFFIQPSISRYRSDSLNDIDRVIRMFRGDQFHPRSLESAMNTAFQAGEDYECDVFKARHFCNGNLHLWIKDESAVERVDEAIAEHDGEGAIPAQRGHPKA